MNGKNPDIGNSEASMQVAMDNAPSMAPSTGSALPHGPLPMPTQELERNLGIVRLLRIPRLVTMRK